MSRAPQNTRGQNLVYGSFFPPLIQLSLAGDEFIEYLRFPKPRWGRMILKEGDMLWGKDQPLLWN